MSIKDRLIQFVLRGKDEMSPEARKVAEALKKVSAEGDALRKSLDSANEARGLVNGLKQTQRAVEQAEKALVQGDLQIRELREALNKAPESAGLQQSLKDAEREARRAQKQLSTLTASLAEQEAAAREAGVDTRNLADEEKRLAAQLEDAKLAANANEVQLRELERQQNAAARSAGQHTSRINAAKQAMSSGAKQVLGFAAAYLSLNAAAQALQSGLNLVRDGIRSMLETGDRFEGLQTQLTALMGSIEGGEQATAWIKDFAKTTPLQLDEVTQAFSLLKAFGLDPMDGTLQAITDQSEKLGGGMEKLQGIATALGQAWAKERLQGEEILQLIERGVPVYELLADATGKTGAELRKLSSDGKLGRDAIKSLIAEIGQGSAGAAAANMSRLSGIVSNLRDTFSDFLDRIASSGALDYVKAQLSSVADTIDEMDRDGRLEALAESLSNAFVQGAEKAKEFILKLGEVDFNRLIDDSTAWFNSFGSQIDATVSKIDLLTRPLRTGANLVTAFFSAWVTGLSWALSKSLAVVGGIVDQLPDMLGGAKLKAGVDKARETLDGLTDGAADQFKQDMQDLQNIWSSGNAAIVDDSKRAADERVAAAKSAADQQRMLDQALADELIDNQKRVKESALDAAVAGTAAIESMAQAMQLIDSASTVQQLEGLKRALLESYREGRISQEEYNAGLNLTNERISRTGAAAQAATSSLTDLVGSLEDFAGLQSAIKGAETDVDISKLGAAARKMYSDGKLTADEYRKALAELEKQKAEVKKATDTQGRAEAGLASQIGRVTQALDEQAQAEQRAQDAAAAASAKRAEEANAWGGYFDSVMSSAREPLAQLSEQALATFDAIRGITQTDVAIDTSGIEATRVSLERLDETMGRTQRELANVMRGPFARWASENISQSQQIQKEYLQQKLALQELMDRYERGATSLAGFRTQAMSLKGSLNLLNDSDLSQLDNAIASVEQRMESLGNSARSTLDSMRDELDRLRGNEEAIERRRLASRERELRAQLAEARASGNGQAVNDLQQALGMLRSIASETELARSEAERSQRRGPTQATGPGTAQPAGQAGPPSRVIRLESARGTAVDVSVPEGQEDALLSILEQSGMRTI